MAQPKRSASSDYTRLNSNGTPGKRLALQARYFQGQASPAMTGTALRPKCDPWEGPMLEHIWANIVLFALGGALSYLGRDALANQRDSATADESDTALTQQDP